MTWKELFYGSSSHLPQSRKIWSTLRQFIQIASRMSALWILRRKSLSKLRPQILHFQLLYCTVIFPTRVRVREQESEFAQPRLSTNTQIIQGQVLFQGQAGQVDDHRQAGVLRKRHCNELHLAMRNLISMEILKFHHLPMGTLTWRLSSSYQLCCSALQYCVVCLEYTRPPVFQIITFTSLT